MSQRAFSLIELVVSIGITTILLGAAGLTIGLASKSMSATAEIPAAREASMAIEQMVSDISLACAILERTATAIECTVPDRDEDGADERVRYSWSGVAGAPLMYEYNGSPPSTLLPHVNEIDLRYTWQMVQGTSQWSTSAVVDPASLRFNVLVIVRDVEDIHESNEQPIIDLIESWNHTVILMNDDTPPDQFDGVEDYVDVVVITGNARDNELGDVFRLKPVGILVMNAFFADELGLASSDGSSQNDDDISILNANHYITFPYQDGSSEIATNDQSIMFFDNQTITNALVLTTHDGYPSTSILRPGTRLMDSDDLTTDLAPATRVFLPYAKSNLKIHQLTEDGITLIKRGLEWAATGVDAPPAPITGEVLQAHPDDPLIDNNHDSIDPDDGIGTCIIPVLPPTAISWKLTGFRFLAARDGSPDGLVRVQVYRADLNGLPTGPPMAVAEILEYELAEDPEWVEVTLGMEESLAQHERACIVIGTLGVNGAAAISADKKFGETTPAFTFFDGVQGDWEIEPELDLIFEAWGVYEEGGL